MKSTSIAKVLVCVPAALVVTACSGDKAPPPEGRLLDGPPVDLTAEAERRRSMQAITLLDKNNQDKPVTFEEADFIDKLELHCNAELDLSDDWFLGCQRDAVRRHSCVGGYLLALAQVSAQPIDLIIPAAGEGAEDEEYTVLPQSTPARAMLARTAYEHFVDSAWSAINGLNPESLSTCHLPVVFGDDPIPIIAASLPESYHRAQEAMRLYVDLALAVSDAEFSSSASNELRNYRSNTWRAEVAGRLVKDLGRGDDREDPGVYQMPKIFANGMCGAPDLTPGGQAALKVLRQSGIAPYLVLSTPELAPNRLGDRDGFPLEVSIADIVEGPVGSSFLRGGVRQRLGLLWGQELASNLSVPDYFGLTLDDFSEARIYLGQEIEAYQRSGLAHLQELDDPSSPYAMWYFAGTSEPPPDRDPVFYAAIARYVDDPEWRDADNTGLSVTTMDRDNLAGFVARMVSWSTYLLGVPDIAENEDYRRTVSPHLAMLAASSDRQGKIVYCAGGDSDAERIDSVWAHEYHASDGLILVKDEDGLECATKGNVEGAPCDLAGYQIAAFSDDESALHPGYNSKVRAVEVGVGFERSSSARDNGHEGGTNGYDIPERWYVVKPRRPGAPVLAGNYVPVVGFIPQGEPEDEQACRDIPVVPAAIELAGRVLKPDPEWCSAKFLSCAGSEFDERLPLENELSDDHDGVESSWRHYLTLARQAATESDLLGQEYFAASLEVAQREEELDLRRMAQEERAAAEMERLQQVCGTAVDPKTLMEYFSDQGSISEIVQDEPCDSSTTLPPATSCVGGVIISWWEGKLMRGDEMVRLNECIFGFDDVARFVSLGDAELCLWEDDDGNVCTGEFEGFRCPDIKRGAECQAPEDRTAVPVPPEETLQFFNTKLELPPPAKPSLCSQFRRLRDNPKRGEDFSALVASGIFNSTDLKRVRDRIGFAAKYGGYVDIAVDSIPKWTTGTATVPSPKWPCTTVDAPTCAADEEGLFCQALGDCSDFDERARVNDRLWKAVLMAHAIADPDGDHLPKQWMPVYLHRNTKPMGGVLQPIIAIEDNGVGGSVDSTANTNWRRFTGDLDENHFARVAFGIWNPETDEADRIYLSQDNRNDVWFTLALQRPMVRRSSHDNVPDLNKKLLNGLSASAAAGGWFEHELTGESHDDDIDIGDLRIAFPGEFFLDHGCGASDFGSACDTERHRRIRESLADMDLDMPEEHNGTVRTKPDELPDFPFTARSLMDGLELLCHVSQDEETYGECPKEPPAFENLSDLGRMGHFLQCLGDEVSQAGATAVYPNFPIGAIDPMRKMSGSGVYDAVPGDIGAALSDIRSGLLQVAASQPMIGRTIRAFGEDMKSLQAALNSSDVGGQIAEIRFEAQRFGEAAACATSYGNAITADVPAAIGGLFASAATCVNSLAQIGFADQLRDLQQEQLDFERDVVIADFNKRFVEHATALETEALNLKQGLELVQRSIGELASLQQDARRSVDKALWLLSQEAESAQTVTTALEVRSETARVRYERAHDNAKKMAFIAKRAIEQRLGMRLASMADDLPLVDAPQSWEGTVCATSGLDFAALTDPDSEGPRNFADSFIGDYVTKLEQLVESYRLTHGFHEGMDTTVASLRDDLLEVRADCEVESENLLYHASRFDALYSDQESANDGWFLDGCGEASAAGSCIRVDARDEAPFAGASVERRNVRGYTVSFGSAYVSDASLVQAIPLEPGRYRFSWYTPDDLSDPGATAGVVFGEGGQAIPQVALTTNAADTTGIVPGDDITWNRPYFLFDVEEAKTVYVGFTRPGTATNIVVAAAMLERVRTDSLESPRVFSNTDESRVSVRRVCEDTDGDVFRREYWTRDCVNVCPDGNSSNCSSGAVARCYHETSFHVSQRGIAHGGQFGEGGFAYGNFNYRIESLGLNFVGTGLRQCEDAELPTTCFSAGYVPYSLIHEGPFYVRNHQGTDFEAYLFDGRIEHARGLATERYFSNPMGTADQELLTQYLRHEFQGRPLDGHFVLRIWEDEGFDFSALDDVQIILNYRYWTGFD